MSALPQARSRSARSLLVAVALALVAGCGGSQDGAPPPKEQTTKYAIGVSQGGTNDAWQAQLRAGLEAAAREHPELAIEVLDAGDDPQEQKAHIEGFIAKGVDLIVVNPADAPAAQAVTQPVGRALHAAIPVIVLDRPVIGDQYTCFITADDHQIAAAAGRWLAERMGGKGRLIELKSSDDAGPGAERHRGFRDAIRDYPDLRVLRECPTTADPASARKAMVSALSDFGEIDALFAHTDAAAHAAYLAAKESGRADEMLWVAIGALPDEGIAYVEQGILTATFEYPTGAREAIAIALDVLAGKDVPKHLTLTPRVFTQANLAQGGEPIGQARPSSGKKP